MHKCECAHTRVHAKPCACTDIHTHTYTCAHMHAHAKASTHALLHGSVSFPSNQLENWRQGDAPYVGFLHAQSQNVLQF
jgi:hypothetical protein